jgi:hypothetical protein
LFPVAQARKIKISGKYPVIVGLFPANISEMVRLKLLKSRKKPQKAAEKTLKNGENRFWIWYSKALFI